MLKKFIVIGDEIVFTFFEIMIIFMIKWHACQYFEKVYYMLEGSC